MEYTQEQLDKIIADSKAEATKGLFTEADLKSKVTSEVDRRVETGIQKGLETQRAKWEAEITNKANLTAEELAKQKLQEQLDGIATREKEIARRGNLLDAKDLLTEAKVPSKSYAKMLDMLISDDGETTKSNVANYIEMFNTTKVDIEAQVKSGLAKIDPPSTGGKTGVVTKDQFGKMKYGEKLKFKAESPDLYKQLIKE